MSVHSKWIEIEMRFHLDYSNDNNYQLEILQRGLRPVQQRQTGQNKYTYLVNPKGISKKYI